MACSGPWHNPRVPRSSSLLLAASQVPSCLEVANVRGHRDPSCPEGTCLECPRRGRGFPTRIRGFLDRSATPDVGSDSDHQNVEGMASGVAFHRGLGVCRRPGNFFRFGFEVLQSSMSYHVA